MRDQLLDLTLLDPVSNSFCGIRGEMTKEGYIASCTRIKGHFGYHITHANSEIVDKVITKWL